MIAAEQYGVVTRKQLLEAGLTPAGIKHRLATGRLYRVHHGVYLVGHTAAPPLAAEMAAVLACGEGAVLSHRSAALLWRVLKRYAGYIEVSIPRRRGRGRPGIKVHRPLAIDPRDITRLGPIPVTRPAVTLLDLAEVASPRELEIAWDEAHTRRLVKPGEMARRLERSPGRRGSKAIRALLERDAAPRLTRSEKEELLLALIRAAGLPEPELNVLLGRYRVDFAWRDARLVVEVDGPHHLRPRQRDADNRRDSDLHDGGWRVERISDHELINHPEAVIARVARALAKAGA